ncbi:MAG: hypothetical protein EXQ86_02490 [Rhodospirillales bacterium]|nr:hypothetical protein [Rhodospirillales bacterium]
MAAVFAVITAVGWFVFHTALLWAPVVSGSFLLLALAAPGVLLPVNRIWSLVAARLGKVLNFVLLAAFFYGIMLPMGLALRLLGRDPATRGFDAAASTYFQPVARKTTSETLRDMF